MSEYSYPYPTVDAVLHALRFNLQDILESDLRGLYVTGSLEWGDFDIDISDIDLMAITKAPLTDEQFERIEHMHEQLIEAHPEWYDRIEVVYVPEAAAKNYKSESFSFAVISPGEPLHRIQSNPDWRTNFHLVQEKGRAIIGPDPKELIAHSSTTEFIEWVRAHIKEWPAWMPNVQTENYQAYAILTMCRGLYSVKHKEQVSKKTAAAWAAKTYPQWKELIIAAEARRKAWRSEATGEIITFDTASQFVSFAADEIDRL